MPRSPHERTDDDRSVEAPFVVSEETAARLIGVGASSLKKARLGAVHGGRLIPPPFVQLGRRIRYVVSDLLAYIERNKRCRGDDA